MTCMSVKGRPDLTANTNPYTVSKRALRGFFGNFPQVKLLIEHLQGLKDYTCKDEEPECLAIIGQTGTGKTTLLTKFVNRSPRTEHADHTEVPVLYVEVPARCTIKRLSGLMLRTLGSPFWNRGDEEDRTHQLLTLLEGCGVHLIILDEINHLADRGAAKTHYEVGDWIKQLSRASGKPVVLAGTPSASILWETNEQLADRYEVVNLEPLSMEQHRRDELRKVVETFQDLLHGLKVVDLTDEKYLKAIVFASAGRLRDIRRLLVRSVEIAQKEQCLTITRSTLAQAFLEVIYPGAKKNPSRNPFDGRFDGHPLIKTGEPFAPRGHNK